ncbi:Nitrile hydratase [Mesorhizobium plurifarium]|uniref:Nitrile hydratase subunit beta n=1 Tax=Mesorhizobium plurifarium TaxID=69974 RepID=A0A090ESX8_MESPL|nr:Nitrile hydratase [Mesorhizobium plurifarium]
MDGIHDLGGMHGFGAVAIGEDDYVFRHEWQRRSFGLAQALAGTTPFCADMHRHKIELIRPVDYLTMDYFEKWMIATSELLKDAGLVNESELRTGRKEFDVDLARHPPARPDALVEAMKRGAELKFGDEVAAPGFVVGEAVRVRCDAPAGHTRVPRYVRGRLGQVVADHGVFQFADTVARGEGASPQHCYAVAFTADALWGGDAESASDLLYLDLAEAYLDRV